MELARWNRIEEILQAALDLEPDARPSFLDRACGSDEALRKEIAALLAREADADLLSQSPVSGFLKDARQLLTGRTISHYRLGPRIGAGGMGEVYEAHDDNLQRTVALKVLPSEFVSDEDRVRRFEQEAFAASRLNHPNIITIFEVLHSDGAHFIATERVDGETLRDILTDRTTGKARSISAEKALDIAIQVATALKAAHTNWIIHRDIKPENIMVRSDGVVKVLDFGIAKLSEEPDRGSAPQSAATDPSLTTPGAILGTANYMSPEQARGEPLDGRTDLFSLGLVLYEMLAGERLARPALSGESTGELLSPRRIDRVPKELQRVIRRLLRPNRDERHATAGELLDDLHAVKRRIESRTARRVVGISLLAVLVALIVTAIAAMLSIHESWEERVLRDGHSAAARQAVFSPDGRLIVTCGEDGQVLVWDFARRQRVAALAHPSYKLAYSPDGRWVATGGTDSTIAIWDTRTWRKARVLRGHKGEIAALTFSPDSTLLASAAAEASLWRTADWTRVHEWPDGSSHGTFAFSRDGRQLIAAAQLMSLDLKDKRELSRDPVRSFNWLALAPDGRQLAGIDAYGELAFFSLPEPGNLSRLQLKKQYRAHQDHGRAVAYSPDGRLVASASEDIQIWDTATLQKVARFEYTAIVWSVAFSPDGRWLLSAHGDGAVLIWNVAERERVASLNEHSGAVRAVTFSPNGQLVASGGEDRTVTLWDLERGRKQAVLTAHDTRVTAVAFSNDGRELASADQRGVLLLWDLVRRAPRVSVEPPVFKGTYTVAISPDRRFVAVTYGVFTADGRMVVDFLSPKYAVNGQTYGADFSPDGRWLATASTDGGLRLWDGQNFRVMATGRAADEPRLICVAFSADGEWLVTGEDQGRIRLWSVSPLREVATLGAHAARVKSVAFSPDGRSVASAGDDKMIALWDVKRRRLRGRIGTHASPIYSVAFSPDGLRLVSGEHDRTVRVYTRQRSLWGFELE